MDKVTKKRRGNEGVEYERAICKGGRAVLAYLYRDAEFLVMPRSSGRSVYLAEPGLKSQSAPVNFLDT